jgi:hypothetical protein
MVASASDMRPARFGDRNKVELTSAQAAQAQIALANNAYAQVPNPAPAAGNAGASIFNNGAPGGDNRPTVTPKISGKLLVTMAVSGHGTAAAETVGVTLHIGAQSFSVIAAPGGDAGFTTMHTISVITEPPNAALLPLQVPVTIDASWLCSGATQWAPVANEGHLTVVELN